MDVERVIASELFSVSGASRWLRAHGVDVHENTVRYWVTTGRLPVLRRRREALIAIEDLRHIASCPFCRSR